MNSRILILLSYALVMLFSRHAYSACRLDELASDVRRAVPFESWLSKLNEKYGVDVSDELYYGRGDIIISELRRKGVTPRRYLQGMAEDRPELKPFIERFLQQADAQRVEMDWVETASISRAPRVISLGTSSFRGGDYRDEVLLTAIAHELRHDLKMPAVKTNETLEHYARRTLALMQQDELNAHLAGIAMAEELAAHNLVPISQVLSPREMEVRRLAGQGPKQINAIREANDNSYEKRWTGIAESYWQASRFVDDLERRKERSQPNTTDQHEPKKTFQHYDRMMAIFLEHPSLHPDVAMVRSLQSELRQSSSMENKELARELANPRYRPLSAKQLALRNELERRRAMGWAWRAHNEAHLRRSLSENGNGN